MINTATSDLAGIDTATLQQWMKDVQNAIHDLAIGGKPVVVTYTQGDGQKSVTYTKADMGILRAYLQEIKAQLGIGSGRGAFRPIFRG